MTVTTEAETILVDRNYIDALIRERDRLKGDAEVLRGLLREADFVLKSVAEHDEDEGMRALRMMIAAAIDTKPIGGLSGAIHICGEEQQCSKYTDTWITS